MSTGLHSAGRDTVATHDDLFLALAVLFAPERLGDIVRTLESASPEMSLKGGRITRAPQVMVRRVAGRLLAGIGILPSSTGSALRDADVGLGEADPRGLLGQPGDAHIGKRMLLRRFPHLFKAFGVTEVSPLHRPALTRVDSQTILLHVPEGDVYLSFTRDLVARAASAYLSHFGYSLVQPEVHPEFLRFLAAVSLIDAGDGSNRATIEVLDSSESAKSLEPNGVEVILREGSLRAAMTRQVYHAMCAKEVVELGKSRRTLLEAISVSSRLRLTFPLERLSGESSARLSLSPQVLSRCKGELVVNPHLRRCFAGSVSLTGMSVTVTVNEVENA